MFETRTVPRFLLLPAFALGAAAVVAWSCGPFGDHTHLQFERAKYVAMRDLQHQAAGETIRWKAVYGVQAGLLRQARTDGARALRAASARAKADNHASFNAGVIAGRVLERKAHALHSGDPAAARPASGDDGVFVDFRDLWRSGDGPDPDGGKDLSARGDGGSP